MYNAERAVVCLKMTDFEKKELYNTVAVAFMIWKVGGAISHLSRFPLFTVFFALHASILCQRNGFIPRQKEIRHQITDIRQAI